MVVGSYRIEDPETVECTIKGSGGTRNGSINIGKLIGDSPMATQAVTLEINEIPFTLNYTRGRVTIPTEIMSSMGWRKGDTVTVRVLGYHMKTTREMITLPNGF